MTKASGWLKNRRRRAGGSRTALSRDAFRRRLDEERIRADRSGKRFTCLLFDVKTRKERESAGGILETLGGRVRSIDRYGWFDADTLGVILPYTPREGAMKFAADVRQTLEEEGLLLPRARVLCYPHDGVDDVKNRRGKNSAAGAGRFTGGTSLLFIRKTPAWKKAIDILVAGVSLLLLSPLMAAIALYVKLVSRGPVLFRQERVGRGGKIFSLIKFRTMHANSESHTHRKHLHDLMESGRAMKKLDSTGDSRIIPLGRFIRELSLDELPQLMNVLKGEMSLIGPRPCLPYEADQYLMWHAYRFDVMPGMTGLWQVSGKNNLSFRRMIELDIQYAERMSPFLDLLILLRTLPAVIMIAGEGFANTQSMRRRRVRRALHSMSDTSLRKGAVT